MNLLEFVDSKEIRRVEQQEAKQTCRDTELYQITLSYIISYNIV